MSLNTAITPILWILCKHSVEYLRKNLVLLSYLAIYLPLFSACPRFNEESPSQYSIGLDMKWNLKNISWLILCPIPYLFALRICIVTIKGFADRATGQYTLVNVCPWPVRPSLSSTKSGTRQNIQMRSMNLQGQLGRLNS